MAGGAMLPIFVTVCRIWMKAGQRRFRACFMRWDAMAAVVMMSWLGHRTGLLAGGKLNRPSAFSGRPLAGFPAYRGSPWFLPVVGRYYQFRDWLERRLDS